MRLPPLFFTRILLLCCTFSLANSGFSADRRGENEPFSSSTSRLVFPDDELFVFFEDVSGDNMAVQKLEPTAVDLSAWDKNDSSKAMGRFSELQAKRRNVRVAKGLICHEDTNGIPQERAALAYFKSYNEFQLDVVDSSGERINKGGVTLDCDESQSTYYNDCDVAIYDIDNEADLNERYVDEIVVGQIYHHSGDGKLGIQVLTSIIDHDYRDTFDIPDDYFQMRLEVGNFDGVGLPEIAVILFDGLKFRATIYQWDPEHHTITESSSYTHTPPFQSDGFDTASGDFNGDGIDDVAVLASGYAYMLETNGSLVFEKKSDHNVYDGASFDHHWRIEAGLFHFDPSDGYGMNRRQFVVLKTAGGTDDPMSISMEVYRIGEGFGFHYLYSAELPTDYFGIIGNTKEAFYPSCDIAVGNFIGHDGVIDSSTNQVPPTDQILLSCHAGLTVTDYMYSTKYYSAERLVVYDPSGSRDPVWSWHSDPEEFSWRSDFPDKLVSCVGLDVDGDRYLLGTPAHIYIEGKNKVNALMEEPPKHVDLLPVDYRDWDGDWDIVNVSAYPDFHVVFGKSSETEDNTETETTSDHTIGGSLAIKASETVRIGTAEVATSTVKLRQKLKVEGHYSSHEKNWDSDREKRSTKLTLTTNEADVIYGTKHGVDLWRYPIINMKDDDGKNCFYEVVIPAKPYDFTSTSNEHHDWYQPYHINHSLLSYPDATSDFPPDLGEFFDNDGDSHNDLLSNHAMFLYSGNEAELEMEWSSETGSGSSTSHEHEISEDASFEVGFTTKARVVIAEEEESFSVKASFNNSNSWGDAKVSEQSVSKSKTITVAIPEIPLPSADWEYSFTPVSYITKTGYLKVSHAVDFNELVSDGPNWAHYYGGRPDLSFNLAERFEFSKSGESVYGTWDLNTDESRMEMSQHYLRYATPDPVTGKYPLVSDVPAENDQLRLEARVYNLCVYDTVTTHTKVRFDHVLVDSTNLQEYPETRTAIGTTTILPVGPRETRMAVLEFTPTGMADITPPAGAPSDAVFGYRFYAVIDPDNEVPNEIHEWKTDTNIGVEGWSDDEGRLYHGNNEGYWPKGSVVFIDSASKDETVTKDGYYLFFGDDGLGLKVDDQLLVDTMPLLHNHESYPLRVHLRSTSTHDQYHRVLIEVQRNGEQPQMLDEIIVRDQRMDTYVWTRWTPREMGRYSIRATIVGEEDSELKTTDEIIVNVLEAVNTGWMLY